MKEKANNKLIPVLVNWNMASRVSRLPMGMMHILIVNGASLCPVRFFFSTFYTCSTLSYYPSLQGSIKFYEFILGIIYVANGIKRHLQPNCSLLSFARLDINAPGIWTIVLFLRISFILSMWILVTTFIDCLCTPPRFRLRIVPY